MEKKLETISLTCPVEFEGETITEVTWRRLTGKDVINADREMMARAVGVAGEAERTYYMVAQAIDKPVEFLDKIDIYDYTVLLGKTSDFLSKAA